MSVTRLYSIEIKDLESSRTVFFSAIDLTNAELKIVIERNLRLAGLPADAGLTAPADDAGTEA